MTPISLKPISQCCTASRPSSKKAHAIRAGCKSFCRRSAARRTDRRRTGANSCLARGLGEIKRDGAFPHQEIDSIWPIRRVFLEATRPQDYRTYFRDGHSRSVAIARFQPNRMPVSVAFMVMEKLTGKRVTGLDDEKLYNLGFGCWFESPSQNIINLTTQLNRRLRRHFRLVFESNTNNIGHHIIGFLLTSFTSIYITNSFQLDSPLSTYTTNHGPPSPIIR